LLNLSINSLPENSVTLDNLEISANNSSASYVWIDCVNNVIIPGENDQSFTATANGSYAVQLTENSCVDTSTCILISTVDLIENSFSGKVRVYPNPTKGLINIELNEIETSISARITTVS